MGSKLTGMKPTLAMLRRLSPEAEKRLADANSASGAEIARTAKLLIPVDSGVSKTAITQIDTEDGRTLIDFGPKSKVIEGGRAPRPFVNPALRFTRQRRRARARRAVREAVKIAAQQQKES